MVSVIASQHEGPGFNLRIGQGTSPCGVRVLAPCTHGFARATLVFSHSANA